MCNTREKKFARLTHGIPLHTRLVLLSFLHILQTLICKLHSEDPARSAINVFAAYMKIAFNGKVLRTFLSLKKQGHKIVVVLFIFCMCREEKKSCQNYVGSRIKIQKNNSNGSGSATLLNLKKHIILQSRIKLWVIVNYVVWCSSDWGSWIPFVKKTKGKTISEKNKVNLQNQNEICRTLLSLVSSLDWNSTQLQNFKFEIQIIR